MILGFNVNYVLTDQVDAYGLKEKLPIVSENFKKQM